MSNGPTSEDGLSGRSTIALALLSIVAGVSAILVGVLFSAVWYAWGGLAALGILAIGYLAARYVAAHRHRSNLA